MRATKNSRAAGVLRGVADDLRARRDPAAWARRLGFALDPWQVDVLTTPKRRACLNCTRQGGKTEAAALRVLLEAVTKPGAVCLLYSPSLRQSGELFRRVLGPYRAIEADNPTKRETILTIELANGSRIIALPGKESTTRTYTADLVVVDEAARVPDGVLFALSPMLAVTGGALVLLSTPRGPFGFFAEAWRNGDPATWHKVRVTAPMLPGIVLTDPHEPDGVCTRIPIAHLKEERARMPEAVFLSEYYGEFLAEDHSAFSYAAIDAAMSSDLEPWDFSTDDGREQRDDGQGDAETVEPVTAGSEDVEAWNL